MRRRAIFLLIFVGLIFSVTLPAIHAGDAKYPVRIAVLGDRTGGHVPGSYGDVVGEVELLKPDYVLTVGDMIEGYIDDRDGIIKEWDEYDSIMARLEMPVYYTPGNHDIWSDLSEEIYRERYFDPYYSIDIEGIHVIFLDNSRTETSANLEPEQITWLVDDLKQNQNADHIMVFMHKPCWFENIADGKPDSLHEILVEYGVGYVFTGHYHEYFVGDYDGIKYTGVGSSGAWTGPGPSGLDYHYIWMTVDRDDVNIAVMNKGSVLDWKEITADERKDAQKMSRLAVKQVEPVKFDYNMEIMDSVAIIRVNNLSDSLYIKDSLRWSFSDGWEINPPAFPVEIRAGSRATTFFRIKNIGDKFPVPEFSIDMPYAEGKTFTVAKPLLIARTAHCMPADKKPKIDGDISEIFWAYPNENLFHSNDEFGGFDPVKFYFAYDADNLYIAAKCMESKPDSIIANVKERDGAIYGEDCIGYFFQPVTDTAIVYQIYINPLGTVFDQLITFDSMGYSSGDRSWNGDYEIKTARGEDFWSVEARIPLKQFDVIGEASKEWRLNFRRKQKRINAAADWQTPIDYNPETFGRLVFN